MAAQGYKRDTESFLASQHADSPTKQPWARYEQTHQQPPALQQRASRELQTWSYGELAKGVGLGVSRRGLERERHG